MAKRYRERPTARQIISKADRDAAYERARDVHADWLNANFAPAPEPVQVRLSRADIESARDYALFQRDLEIDSGEHDVVPDKLGKTGTYEPKSIYDPAPRARVSFERPKKRKGRDPLAVSDDCEIPDYRRKQTFVLEDAQGRARGAIEINPFSKRVKIGGFGL